MRFQSPIALRMFINTFLPIPLSLKGRRVNVGDRVFEADVRRWVDETYNKVEWYLQLEPLAIALLEEVRRVSLPEQDVLGSNETGHTSPRYWRFLFRRVGFVEERYEKLLTSKGDSVSLITWRRPE